MKKVLTIAGSDCSGGAGIQMDLKVMTVHNVYGMAVMTALTAQNTQGIFGIEPVSPEFLDRQLQACFSDIMPDAVKIGMISTEEQVEVVMQCLEKYKPAHVVFDPVLSATTGAAFQNGKQAGVFLQKLFPYAELITPNLPEASFFVGREIKTEADMEMAGRDLGEVFGCQVLVKGGHLVEKPADLLWSCGKMIWIKGERVENPNTHGTGCCLSSAIACHLAKGDSLEEAVKKGKKYVAKAIEEGLALGKGAGPVNPLVGEFTDAS